MDGEDQLLKSLFTESATNPSSSISEKVMQQIEKSSEVFEYKPLISKKTWIVMGSIFSVTMIYLLSQTAGVSMKAPELISLLGSGFLKLKNNFSFDLSLIQLPQISSTFLTSLVALIIVGVYLIISYKWSKRMFR